MISENPYMPIPAKLVEVIAETQATQASSMKANPVQLMKEELMEILAKAL